MQDFSPRLSAVRDRLDEASGYLRIEQLTARRPQLEAELGRPDLWDDQDAAQAVQREFAELEDDLTLYNGLTERLDDVDTLEREFDRLELRSLFTGEYDERDAIVDVNSGAGGVDAQDWAEMLLRMYLRWAERRGFDIELDS